MADGRLKWGSRLLWFVGLWAAGVVVVTIVGFAIRALIV